MQLIKLTQGQFAKVDDEDYEWLSQWKWYALRHKETFYAMRNIIVNGRRTTQRMHQLIMGDNPLKLDIDHIWGDGIDNQKHMLRFCTHQENVMNAKPRKNCSSKYKGVSWDKRSKIWESCIKINGKKIFLGYFIIEEDAARTYDAACIKYFGEFARPNFPVNKSQKWLDV